MQKLSKKVCIQINDIYLLKECIDEQLGCVGKYQKCKYTAKHRRDHFVKSKQDEWQRECRIFWDTIKYCTKYYDPIKEVEIIIPQNTAKVIYIDQC